MLQPKHHLILYRNTPPSVWGSGLSWLASLHIAGHQLMHAVKVVSCHACMAHTVLHHQLLHSIFDIPKTSPRCRNAFLLSPSVSEFRFPV